MAKDQKNLFKEAEALGRLKSGPVMAEPTPEIPHESKVIDNPNDFQFAIGQAQMAMQEGEGEDFVEVSPELFRYLVKNQKTSYLTYGDPGIKVYLAGTREACEIRDSLSADEAYTRTMMERSRKSNSVV